MNELAYKTIFEKMKQIKKLTKFKETSEFFWREK